jgi:pentatricopeptide repeat protein
MTGMVSSGMAQQPAAGAKTAAGPATEKAKVAPAQPVAAKLPLSGLEPALLVPDLCSLRYQVSTASPQCQAYFDQGLGYYYSYVWLEAVRSFETAVRHDPNCAMAWWGLGRAFDRHGKPGLANQAYRKAGELRGQVSWREAQLIQASLQEKALLPNSGNAEACKKAAIATIDEILAVHDEDEEAWYFRAQLAGGAGLFGGELSSVPFYKALVRINPLHPGANHELLHYYEKCQRPALGWMYAEHFIESSPGIPHPFHMQAHLAARIGRWAKTSDRSAHAIEMERRYHKEQNVKPSEDQQYGHHIEVLLASLIHDGRLREGREIQREMERCGFKPWLIWFRLACAEGNWEEAIHIADQVRKHDKPFAAYMAAQVALRQGNLQHALSEIEVMQQACANNRGNKMLEYRLWEVQGLYLCCTGAGEPGLKLLARAVDQGKNDYSQHAWGNGSYYMERWGLGALKAGKLDVAQEAYLEALAHDAGCARAALGLQVLSEHNGQQEEANRYANLARRCWSKADPGVLEKELAELRGCFSGHSGSSATSAERLKQ